MRVLLVAACLLGLLAALLPAPALAQEPGLPTPEQEAERLEAERLEAERLEAERLEAERVAAQRAEQERKAELTRRLDASRRDLGASEQGLITALANANRATGDLVVARLDIEDARQRLVDAEQRLRQAERRVVRATARFEAATEALAAEAAAAYRAGSTSQTPPMVAMEALVRSENPREFVRGLDYLNQMLSGRAEQRGQAQLDMQRGTVERGTAERARQRAEEDVAAAQEALTAAEAAAPVQESRLAVALRAHVARTADLAGFADAQRRATEAANVPELTPGNVKLAGDLFTLAASSAETAERLRAGSARIAAGREGVRPWRDFGCPVDGPTQFVNDWGFPRTGGRSHEGTDVFAARGTPVVAMADAVVVRISHLDAGLGGRTVTYEVDGHRVYNAHLETIEPGLAVGDAVPAGQRIGTVGTSGNARTTPPHNHLGMYLPDGAPVNPYPILRRACR